MARRKRQFWVATTQIALSMFLAATSTVGADEPAVVQAVGDGDQSGRVEPVGGLLSEIFGGSNASDRAGSSASSGGDRQPPNWDGVPYHAPEPMAIPSDASPIRDPGSQNVPQVARGNQARSSSQARSSEASRPARIARRPSTSGSGTGSSAPTVASSRRSSAAVPTPPSLRAPSAMAAEPPKQAEPTNTWNRSPLSRETSSRRSTRRPVQAARDPESTRDDSRDVAGEAANRLGPFASGPGLSGRESRDNSESMIPRVSRREVAPPDLEPIGSDSGTSSRRTASPGSGAASAPSATSSPRIQTAERRGADNDDSAVNDTPPRIADLTPAEEPSDARRESSEGRRSNRAAEGMSRPTGVPSAEIATFGATPPSLAKEGDSSRRTSTAGAAKGGDRSKSIVKGREPNVERSESDVERSEPNVKRSGPPASRSAKVASSRDRVIALPASSRTPSVPDADRAPADDANVSSELSGVRVTTEGPGELRLHESRDYTIRVENRGSIDVSGIRVRTSVPVGATVEKRVAKKGNVEAIEGVSGGGEWVIDHLGAGQSAELVVGVRATRSGTFDLGVDWSADAIRHAATIRVREPKLELSIDGPDEVVFGETRTYRVRVLNPGDGLAPNVKFTLGPDSSKPQSQPIGDIPAGKEAQFELELTAQDRGGLKIDGLVSGDLDLRAEASKSIRVIAANLEAVLSGPGNRFQGTEASYLLEIANRGNAESRQVAATLRLPEGVDYLGGIDGAERRGEELRWEIDALPPGATREFEFRCLMSATGVQSLAFACRGTAAGEATVNLETKVTSVADLVMSVNDPPAPAPVGRAVPYEITLRNRGSKAAEDVRVVVQFSNGIEPNSVSGHPGRVLTGQAVFEPIESIGAGDEVVLRVMASAEQAGNHRFRTEVRSGEILLVSEEATRFLDDGGKRISRRSGDAETR